MAEIKDYSVTADDNDSASPNGMPEGMAPSGVNNSWRESFARVKRWYEDVSAAKTTTGSSNAYVLAAARVVTAYAAGDSYMIKANHTCTSAGSTLNIDSVGAKSIVTPAGAALGAGDITSGGIYIVAYEASADKFMLLAGGSTFSGDITAKTSDGAILNLQTSDTTVTDGSVLGRTDFTAPDEASGTDAILLAASIAAVSEGTFAADNNATKLSFQTGSSGAAVEVASLSSGGNLTLPTDGVVIAAGVNSDVTLTHVHDTGLLLNSTMALQFNDASQYINAPSATVLDINATDEVEINATLADVNANLDVSGTYQGGGTMTTGDNIVIPDGGEIGTATTTDAIDILATGEIGLGGNDGWTGAQLYIYDNSTGRHGLRVVLDNASTAQTSIYASTDGTSYCGFFSRSDTSTAATTVYASNAAAGSAFQGTSAGHTFYGGTTSASHAAFFGQASVTSHYALIGYGTHGCYATSVYCVGAMYKGSGTFLISHPLKSEIEGEPWSLAHSFIEGPQCDLIYRGRATLVDGQATVSMDTKYGMTPGTFVWLTKDIQTFTSNETGWDAVRSSFSGDTITIECQNSSSTDTISWMVVAERNDPNIKASDITDDDGNLIIERPSEPEPDLTPPPDPPEADA